MRKATISQVAPAVRCVAYTRKSTDDVDSDFNSLDAQREACEAYVASQRHEGWVMLPDHYDDAGYYVAAGIMWRRIAVCAVRRQHGAT